MNTKANRKMVNLDNVESVLVRLVSLVQRDCQWFSQHFDQVHGTNIRNQSTGHVHSSHTLCAQHAKIIMNFETLAAERRTNK